MLAAACPSATNRVARLDGGLVRIKLPGGRITPGQLRTVAGLAPGVVEITGRANLQLRGVTDDLTDELVVAGLSDGDAGDRRRGILAAPGSPLVDPILAALRAEPQLDDLSPKWGVTIDLPGRRDDVVVARTADRWCVCWHGGSAVATTSGVPALVARAALGALGRPRRTVALPGTPATVGPLGTGEGWWGAMPFLGRTDAAGLTALASLDAEVVLTPWRGVLVRGGPRSLPGFLDDPADPRTAVVACAGSRGCTSGLTDAPADAAVVASLLRRPVAVHVSGCEKGCAGTGSFALSLVGVAPGRYEVRR